MQDYYTVHQHWDKLNTCMVGKSYPPEFYRWIDNSKLRVLFEKIAYQTEEDYQNLINVLQRFGVKVLRPDVQSDPAQALVGGKYLLPPMQPRNHFIMIGDTLHENIMFSWEQFYNNIRDPSWPTADISFEHLPLAVRQECLALGWDEVVRSNFPWQKLVDTVLLKTKSVVSVQEHSMLLNGANVTRIGSDLYFATETYQQDTAILQNTVDGLFPHYKNHVVNTGGHSDGVFCPVCPGLIISSPDFQDYHTTFPGWEVVNIPRSDWTGLKNWDKLKKQNQGRWWIPGQERNQDVIALVEDWMQHWTGYVEETVFDVNMLMIDRHNVVVLQENDKIFKALDRYGITPHVVNFRHRWFWDGGIHCMTADLDRTGDQQDYFPS